MRGSIRRWPAICLTAALAAMLAACHGAGSVGGTGSGVIPQVAQQNGAVTPNVMSPINIYPGEIVGRDDMFRPHDGDTIKGGRGQTVDKIPCRPTEYLNDYHVHAYLGIIFEGKQVAVPDTIGMKRAGPETNGYVTTAGCFYYIHTHDASGMIHIEDPKNLPPSATIYTLKNVLDVWGMKATPRSFGSFQGPMRVYIGNVTALGQTTVSTYTRFTTLLKLDSIPMRSHEVIWIEIGRPYVNVDHLPPVTFYTEF